MTTVLMFPVDRCRNEIDRIARNLNSLNGETANRYWKLEMRVLAERWKACGFSDDAIAHKVILLPSGSNPSPRCQMASGLRPSTFRGIASVRQLGIHG